MNNLFTRRKQEWAELEELVKKASRWGGVRHMHAEELLRLDELYRRTTVDLSQVASRTRERGLLEYLNRLVISAHGILYLPVREPLAVRIPSFLANGFAQIVAGNWKYHMLSLILLLAGVLGGYKASMDDPAAYYAIMPDQETRRLGAGQDKLEESLRHGRNSSQGHKLYFASFLFGNNLRVGMMSLAGGIFAGLPSLLLIIYNGMIFGAFTAIHHHHGIYAEYWAWILPHGITEMGAIVLCGGMGLKLGDALLRPGSLSRLQSLGNAGREAFRVIMGVAVMLFFAAIIESFLRQSYLSTMARFIFAGSTLVFWVCYFSRGIYLNRRRVNLSVAG